LMYIYCLVSFIHILEHESNPSLAVMTQIWLLLIDT